MKSINQTKKGFASMYMVYSFFLVFIMMMLTVLFINNYKKSFLNALKNDIKDSIIEYHLEKKVPIVPSLEENVLFNNENL